jgi:GNAT superfamily N-acetyltransferase
MPYHSVENAELSDIPDLCELLGILFSLEPDFLPDRKKQAAGLRLILERPDLGRILVVRNGGKVVGMINLLVTWSCAAGAPVVVAEDFVVRPEYRQNGIGALLFEAAETFAREIGAAELRLLTEAANGRAQAFYRKQGLEVGRHLPMRLKFAGPGIDAL